MIEKKRGHIVNIASAGSFVVPFLWDHSSQLLQRRFSSVCLFSAGLSGVSKLSDYCASKFAQVGLSEALRNELASRGLHDIKVSSFCQFFEKLSFHFCSTSSVFFSSFRR
jgi:short-subunit dehydrogenase